MLAILPEVEQYQLYNSWNTKLPSYDSANETTVSRSVEVYLCPSHIPPERLYRTTFMGQSTSWAYASYVGNLGSNFIVDYQDWGPGAQPDGVLYRQSKIRPADIADGTSLTLMAGERVHRDTLLHPLWGFGYTGRVVGDASEEIQKPDDWKAHWGFSSFHPGGAQFLMSDGSVGMLSQDISPNVFRGLSTRAGSESEIERPF
jgi:prepilin-type processing-associated H-X9-DG protein